jgi:hypothetical protein|tara:strand:- start:515 stop:751 length:237 start_codon:yes stop_codon:yes gene_type:complete
MSHQIRKTYDYCPLWKRLLYRFLRGFVFSASPLLVALVSMSPEQWTIGALISVIMGGISGGLQTLDKYLREIKGERAN